MPTLKIVWKRLVYHGVTCPRCEQTEEAIEKAVCALRELVAVSDIHIVLEKEEISLDAFQKAPSQSNQIWIHDRLLEDWLGGKEGQSTCCGVCGDLPCRTLVLDKTVYEAIPADRIIEAGLRAASALRAVKDDGGIETGS